MKQTTKFSTNDQINYQGIRHSRLGSQYGIKPPKKTDLVVHDNIGEDRNTITIQSDASNTTAYEPDNSTTIFSQNIVQRLGNVWRHLILCYDVNLERRQLSKLTREQLDDLGLDRSSVHHEARRSFFDIPSQRNGKLGKSARYVAQRSTTAL